MYEKLMKSFLLRKSWVIVALIYLVLSMGSLSNAKGITIPYENSHLTNNKFENTISMKSSTPSYYNDVTSKAIKPTKKELKQADKLYKKLLKVKKNKKCVISSSGYKNIDRLMGIIDKKYFCYYSLEGSVESVSDGKIKYIIKGNDVKKCVKLNKKLKKDYGELIKKIGLSNETTEHDAVLLINDYLVKYLEYGNSLVGSSEEHIDPIYSRIGICQDYANMFYLISNRVGLKSGIVYDNVLNHAYNVVYIGGKKFYIDACWNDAYGYNMYIFMSKSEVLKSHHISKIVW